MGRLANWLLRKCGGCGKHPDRGSVRDTRLRWLACSASSFPSGPSSRPGGGAHPARSGDRGGQGGGCPHRTRSPGGGVVGAHIGDTRPVTEAKTLGVAEEIYRELDRLRVGRYDTIVGVGGGAATDLAGFVASTWLRGVEGGVCAYHLVGSGGRLYRRQDGCKPRGEEPGRYVPSSPSGGDQHQCLEVTSAPATHRGDGRGPESRFDRRPRPGGDSGGARAVRPSGGGGAPSDSGESASHGRRLFRDGTTGHSQLRAHHRPRNRIGYRHSLMVTRWRWEWWRLVRFRSKRWVLLNGFGSGR